MDKRRIFAEIIGRLLFVPTIENPPTIAQGAFEGQIINHGGRIKICRIVNNVAIWDLNQKSNTSNVSDVSDITKSLYYEPLFMDDMDDIGSLIQGSFLIQPLNSNYILNTPNIESGSCGNNSYYTNRFNGSQLHNYRLNIDIQPNIDDLGYDYLYQLMFHRGGLGIFYRGGRVVDIANGIIKWRKLIDCTNINEYVLGSTNQAQGGDIEIHPDSEDLEVVGIEGEISFYGSNNTEDDIAYRTVKILVSESNLELLGKDVEVHLSDEVSINDASTYLLTCNYTDRLGWFVDVKEYFRLSKE